MVSSSSASLLSHLASMAVSTVLEAKWDKRLALDEESIRGAIYDGLPTLYKNHIDTMYDKDYQDMEENEFLQAQLAYEKIDNLIKQQKKNEKVKQKEEKKQTETAKKTGRGQKRPIIPKHKAHAGKIPKNFCKYCKDNNIDKYWTHDTEMCGHKKRAEAPSAPKEVNAMEEMMAMMKEN